MLLKIQRYDKVQNYWLLDNIRKISVSDPIHSSVKTTHDHDISILDVIYDKVTCDCIDQDRCSNCKYWTELICRLDNGDEISIIFDTIAYVLNDNGKTIEKIVANYND